MPCRWCKKKGKIVDIDEHLLICKLRTIPCENGCLFKNGILFHCSSGKMALHRTVCTMQKTICMFASTGCIVELLRKDMSLHENDAGAHVTLLLKALQKAEAKSLKANESIRDLQSQITDLKSSAEATKLLFKVPIALLNVKQKSATINVSGHEFYLILHPSNRVESRGKHALHLYCLTACRMNCDFEIISHVAPYEPYKSNLRYIFRAAEDGYGYEKFISTTSLMSG